MSPIPRTSNDFYIAVMGQTGVGKSRFIQDCSGLNVKQGETLRSCTTDVDEYEFTWKGTKVHLIDTPGFDDTSRSDRDVLEDIASWMGTNYQQESRLSNILYLHRITDNKVGGTSKRNLIMFKKLCGEDFYPRITLLTTHWDLIDQQEGEKRLSELTSDSDFWQALIEGHAVTERYDGKVDTAQRILNTVLQNCQLDAPDVLKVQREMVDDGLTLDQTDAGKQVESRMAEIREQHKKEIARLQRDAAELMEMKEFQAAREAEEERKVLEAKVRESKEEGVRLRATLEDLQKRQAEDIARLEARAQAQREELQREYEALRNAQSQLVLMDATNPQATALEEDIKEQEEVIMQQEAVVAATEESLRKKVRRLLMRSADWLKDHPEVMRTVAGYGMQFVILAARYNAIKKH